MNPKHLRLGNNILYEGREIIVTISTLLSMTGCCGKDKFKPIAVTEQILIDFDFNKFPGNNNLFDRDDFWTIELTPSGVYLPDFELTIKYVHELQNAYFPLSGGKELTKK
jgi:hypothetical protein